MDEHDSSGKGSRTVKCITEEKIVIILETHATQDDDVNFRLHGDTGKKLVVWFTADGEDRKLLGFNQCIEYIDHRNTSPDHVLWNDSPCRVDRRTADGNHILFQLRSVVPWLTGTVKYTA